MPLSDNEKWTENTLGLAQCSVCQNLIEFGDQQVRCKAFPGGVPIDVVRNSVRHTEKLEGQENDIVFQPVPGYEDYWT